MTACFSPLCQTELVCLLPPGYSSSRRPSCYSNVHLVPYWPPHFGWATVSVCNSGATNRFKFKATQYFSASSLAVSIGPRRGSAQRSDRAWSTEEMRPVKTPLTVRHSAHISLSSRPIGNVRRDEPYQNTCRGPGSAQGREE